MDRPIQPEELDRRRRGRWLRGGAVVLALVLAGWLLPRWLRPTVDRDRLRDAVVETGVVQVSLTATGTVRPLSEEVVACPFDTRLLEVLAAPGARLERGDLLLRLDAARLERQREALEDEIALKRNQSRQLELELEEGLAGLESDGAIMALQVEHSRAELQVEREAYEKRITTASSLRRAELQLEIHEIEATALERQAEQLRARTVARRSGLEIEISLLERQVRELDERIALGELRAPAAGVLTWIADEEGAALAEGALLARVADLDSWRVEAQVSDQHAGRLSVGMPVVVRVDDADLAGEVERIHPAVEQGRITVGVELADPRDPRLRANQRVDVQLVVERRERALRLPRGPWARGSGPQEVFVVDGDGARRRPVTIGLTGFRWVEVTEGLLEGERVLISDMSAWERADELRLR